MIVLQTRGLEKVYGTGEARVRALDGVDLDVEQGEFVAVVGAPPARAKAPFCTCWAGWTAPPPAP